MSVQHEDGQPGGGQPGGGQHGGGQHGGGQHEVEVIENIFIPMADGVLLAARVWRPVGITAPVVLEYLPYRKRDGTRARDQGLHRYLAARGYACVRLDIRGMGDSGGLLHGEYTQTELDDGVAAIAWLAAQDWCDGQVAMIGISWSGFNGLQIATLQPPALRTVITVGSTDDRYATDVHWVGGCLSKDNFDWSATMLAQNDLPPDAAIVGDRWRAMWADRMAANRPWILDWLAHQRRDSFWRHGSVCEDFSRITVPVYAVSGWADNYSEAVPRLMAGLTGPRRGLVGPWAHSYPMDVTVQPAIGWLQEVVRWLDHWLKGSCTGIMDEPMLRVWMQDHVPPRTCYAARPGRWVGEAVWPSPRMRERAFVLGAGEASVCSPLWVGAGAGEIGRYGGDAEWPGDQREDDAGSLRVLGAPLADRTEILGAPRVRLALQCDRPQGLVCVRLCDVAPDGRSTRVTVGLLNLTHRNGHAVPEPLVPGDRYLVEVELDDIAHAFPAGHRVGVSVSTVYWPIAWPSPELATVTVDLAASALILPVRPEDPADAHLRTFDPPEQAAQSPVIWHQTAPTHPRRMVRDLIARTITVDFPRWTYACEMQDIGQTVTSSGHVRFIVTERDPLSAECHTEYAVTLARPDVVAGHWSRGRLWCDASHFHVEIDLRVTEDGATVFENHWRESVPRDHV